MGRLLPNLNQLRCFEAAAPHLSFKDAANELHVTQAAVSQQIRALEEDLGLTLFRRVTRGVKLTPDAEKLAASLRQQFEAMALAVATFQGRCSRRALRISCVPAYGMRILLPRMREFRRDHPDVDIELDLEANLTNFQSADAAIRYGRGNWPDLEKYLLHRDVLSPMCAPSLVDGQPLPLDPERIVRFPIAYSPGSEDDWRSWLQCAGFRGSPPRNPQHLESRAVVLDYLLTGVGAALIDLRFASHELASGKLVRMHPDTVEGVNGIYLVAPKGVCSDNRIETFRQWLVEQSIGFISYPA